MGTSQVSSGKYACSVYLSHKLYCTYFHTMYMVQATTNVLCGQSDMQQSWVELLQPLRQWSNCCRSRKCIRGHIPMHAIFAVFYPFFIPVLSRSYFTSRTPDLTVSADIIGKNTRIIHSNLHVFMVQPWTFPHRI